MDWTRCHSTGLWVSAVQQRMLHGFAHQPNLDDRWLTEMSYERVCINTFPSNTPTREWQSPKVQHQFSILGKFTWLSFSSHKYWQISLQNLPSEPSLELNQSWIDWKPFTSQIFDISLWSSVVLTFPSLSPASHPRIKWLRIRSKVNGRNTIFRTFEEGNHLGHLL